MRKFYAKLGVKCEIEKCENERCMDHLSFFLHEINTRPGAYLGGPRAYVPSIGEIICCTIIQCGKKLLSCNLNSFENVHLKFTSGPPLSHSNQGCIFAAVFYCYFRQFCLSVVLTSRPWAYRDGPSACGPLWGELFFSRCYVMWQKLLSIPANLWLSDRPCHSCCNE